MESCVQCKFYKPHDASSQIGYCFLKAPVVVVLPQPVQPTKLQLNPRAMPQQEFTLQPASVRPLVREQDYCNDWKQAGTSH